MTAPLKPREFWINYYPEHWPHWHVYASEVEADDTLNGHAVEQFHVIESTPLTEAAAEMREALRYCKGTIEQLVNAHTQNGAWKEANALLLRIQSAEAERAKGGGNGA